ncbi:hypothetical protein HDU87_000619 [Geranomyces variabilis]|uniref:Uncharacterized protein n=1 Tax=Geranomyces variabilis TaxID=109894 RepID=A0AAD5XJD3_9FUNG|nr:hypothetical protein HDU87_000619 [Geranomyces variabilis]
MRLLSLTTAGLRAAAPVSARRVAPFAWPYRNTHHLPIGGLANVEDVRKSLPENVAKHLNGYAALVNLPVQWGDQDSYGHLNNVQHMRYFESGRMAYFDQILKPNLTQKAYEDFITPRTVGPIVKSVSMHYRAQTKYPDIVTVGVRIDPESVKKDRFTQKARIVSHANGTVIAECECVIVTFSYEQQRKADIPEEIMAAWRKGEGIE